MAIRISNIYAVMLVAWTLFAIVDTQFAISGNMDDPPLLLGILIIAIFSACFAGMFILPVAGVIIMVAKKKIVNGLFLIIASVFFLLYFMTLDNWDRF